MPTTFKDFPHFFQVLSDPARFTPWKGTVLRQSLPRWASRPFRLTGVGAVLAGGRWNGRNLFPAVYASTNPDTLNAEAHYKGRRYGWSPSDFKTQTQVGMQWELQAVVDLTAAPLLQALGVTTADLTDADWETEQRNGTEPVTQAIARAAFENLAEGLVVPSARDPKGVNIVFYPTHRRDGTVIATADEADIPFMHGL